MRQEVGSDIRGTVISPETTESELADSISDEAAKKGMQEFRKIAISAVAIARSIMFAISQPGDVDISEIIEANLVPKKFSCNKLSLKLELISQSYL